MSIRHFVQIGIVACLLMLVLSAATSYPQPVQAATLTMLGADVSSVQRTLDLGGKYFNASGTQQDPLDILKGVGVNYVRLRVWVNPVSGYNNKAKVLAYAKTV